MTKAKRSGLTKSRLKVRVVTKMITVWADIETNEVKSSTLGLISTQSWTPSRGPKASSQLNLKNSRRSVCVGGISAS